MFYVFNCAHCFGEQKKLNIEMNFLAQLMEPTIS